MTSADVPGDFPFALAPASPEPSFVTQPCGCTFMSIDDDSPRDARRPWLSLATLVQVSWCGLHDPGYQP